jgi:hypothetical protein
MARHKTEWTTPSEAISIDQDGVAHHGFFQVERGMIRVSYGGHSKTTQLGGSAGSSAGLARVILSELVREVPPNS